MTSISSITAGLGSTTMQSRIQSLLQQETSSGAISATDQTALSSAITDIGTALKAGGTATASSTGTTASTAAAATPASMKDQVDSLIDTEVSSGKLTSAQATELKAMFAKVHGGGHHHGGGGAIQSLLASDGTTGTDATSATGSTTSTDPVTGLAQGASGLIDGLASFVNSVRSAVSSNGLYGAGGSTAGRVGSLLVNTFA